MKSQIISSFLFFSLAACSSSNGGGGGGDNPGASGAKTVLEGTWKSTCGLGSSGQYQKNTLSVVNGNFAMTAESYGNSNNCSALLFTLYSAGSFALDATSISTPAGAKSMDSTYTTLILTPSTPAMANALNGASYCGVTNWQSSYGVQLLGKTCDGKTYPASGYIDYSIYQVAGNILNLGDESNAATDGSAPNKRPTGFDTLTLTKH